LDTDYREGAKTRSNYFSFVLPVVAPSRLIQINALTVERASVISVPPWLISFYLHVLREEGYCEQEPI
jgi:hypothetical protein